MIEVVTVYAPRPEHPKFRDYLPAMALQKRTAEKFGCRHLVVSDVDVPGFEALRAELPESLMHAIIVGQIAYLERWSGEHHALLVDADVLITRRPGEAFDGGFDLGLTWRDNPACMINNGAMYVAAGSKERVLQFFRHALSLCKDHWGGDQEAISQAAAPVPMKDGKVGIRQGARVRFLSMHRYNCVPRVEGMEHRGSAPYVVHFKGEDRKEWMQTYAERFVLV